MWVKELFKAQDRPMDCNVSEYKKLIAMALDSTFQTNVRKLPLGEF